MVLPVGDLCNQLFDDQELVLGLMLVLRLG